MKKSIGAKPFLAAVPILIVGSYDNHFQPNLMTCAWGGICCSMPPCVNISLRKNRYSYNNIITRKAFTVNILFSKDVNKADFYGLVSGKNHLKFDKSKIKPVRSKIVEAPYGEEFPIVLECKLLHDFEIGSQTQFIGEILDIKVEEDLLDDSGKLLGVKLDPLLYIPEIREYYTLGEYLGKGFSIGKTIPFS